MRSDSSPESACSSGGPPTGPRSSQHSGHVEAWLSRRAELLASVERLVWEAVWRMGAMLGRSWDQDGLDNAAAAARTAAWDLTRTWREDGGRTFASYVYKAVRSAARRSLYHDKTVGLGGAWRKGRMLDDGSCRVHLESAGTADDVPFLETVPARGGGPVAREGSLEDAAAFVRGSRVLTAAEKDLLLARLSGQTLQVIADRSGVSRERVRQRCVDVLRKLRRNINPYNDPAA